MASSQKIITEPPSVLIPTVWKLLIHQLHEMALNLISHVTPDTQVDDGDWLTQRTHIYQPSMTLTV